MKVKRCPSRYDMGGQRAYKSRPYHMGDNAMGMARNGDGAQWRMIAHWWRAVHNPTQIDTHPDIASFTHVIRTPSTTHPRRPQPSTIVPIMYPTIHNHPRSPSTTIVPYVIGARFISPSFPCPFPWNGSDQRASVLDFWRYNDG